MENYKKLGRTGLKVSPLCLGTMQWGWTADEASAIKVMDTYVEAGGNFIDTADIYSRWAEGNPGGISEEIIGRWLKQRNQRSQIVLATKLRGPMGNGPNDQGLSRKHIFEAVEASLRRLQTDYIDLYQCHSADEETSIEETLAALNDLVHAGKVRYIGASNFQGWQLTEALWKAEVHNLTRFDSLQPHYNMVHRAEFEHDLKKICEKYGVGVIPYSPLAGGFLTGKYTRSTMPESKRAAGIKERYDNEAGWKTIEAVQAVAKDIASTPTAVALAWLLSHPVITAPIIGANTVEQLQVSLAATKLKLDAAHLQQLEEASKQAK
jgi:aryl-alcohol dehydrogenase-like predicted oxidoreductase